MQVQHLQPQTANHLCNNETLPPPPGRTQFHGLQRFQTTGIRTEDQPRSPLTLAARLCVTIYSFGTVIEYVPGLGNPVADALSRLEDESVSTTAPVDFEAMATAQETVSPSRISC